MERVAAELSTLVIHILNLLEPGLLVIGTDAPPLRDWLLERLRAFVEEHGLPHQAGSTQLVASSLGKFGVAAGRSCRRCSGYSAFRSGRKGHWV